MSNDIEHEFEIEVNSVKIEPVGKYSYSLIFSANPEQLMDHMTCNQLTEYLKARGYKVTK